MPSAHPYDYSTVIMRSVYDEPEEYIIPENLEACKLLWSKNIFTVMCNNYDNDDSWIVMAKLDESNQQLFDELCKTNPENFEITTSGLKIKVPIKPVPGADVFSAFKPLIEMFSFQDVQTDGYVTKEDFLNYDCGCYRWVPNPEYMPDLKNPRFETFDSVEEQVKAVLFYFDHHEINDKIRVFDPSKMEMSLEDYLARSMYAGLYDEDNGRVYKNKMYYDAHLRYKKQCKTPKY